MRVIERKIFLVALLSIKLFAQSNPVVSNVTFAQRTDGSLKVDVYYDVFDADGDSLYVTLQASSDNGATWALPVSYVTGDVGGNILSGTNKQIVWEFGREKPNFFSDQVKIKVTATDIKCNGLLVDYGGKVYTTVQIGSQCWLKENLDIGEMISSSATADSQRNNGLIEKYCYYNNVTNCETYGGLYQWNEAMQYLNVSGSRGICPIGWHIPMYSELGVLGASVGNNSNSLKNIGQGYGSGTGTNVSGFSALLAGYRSNSGLLIALTANGMFWSSTEIDESKSYYLNLLASDSDCHWGNIFKTYGFSVRCLKD